MVGPGINTTMNWDELNKNAVKTLGYGTVVETKETPTATPAGTGSGEGGFRTDRHNNPTAMTTDVAATLGLIEGQDYTQGDPFSGGKYYTAKLSGNGVQTTVKALDQAAKDAGKNAFYTKSGQPRWTHTAISDEEWLKKTQAQKEQFVMQMYKKEGGAGKTDWNSPGSTAGPATATPASTTAGGWDDFNAKAKKIYEPSAEQQQQANQKDLVEKTMAESTSPYKLTGDTIISAAPEKKLSWWQKPFVAGYEAVKNTIEDAGNRLGNLFDTMDSSGVRLSDYEKAPGFSSRLADGSPNPNFEKEIKAREDYFANLKSEANKITPADRAGAMISAGVGAANVAFLPVTAPFAAAEETPVLKYPAKAVGWAFGKLGQGGAFVGAELVDILPISDQTKDALKMPVSELTGLLAQVAGGKLGAKAIGKAKATIVSKIAERQAEGIEVTPAEGFKILNETAKEVPAKTPDAVMNIPTQDGNVLVHTTKRVVLENFLKGQEDINYKVVKSLGKDLEGNKVAARFEWDYKKQQATILTTKSTTASNLAHELGHYFDTKIVADIGTKMSDILPNYEANKALIDSSLAQYAVDQLGGNASAKQISSLVKNLANNFTKDIAKLAEEEPRARASDKFASAVREVIMNPKKAAETAPAFTNFVQYFSEKSGFVAGKVKKAVETARATTPALETAPKTFYRGGGQGEKLTGITAQDVVKYEQKELGNKDVKATPGVNLKKIPGDRLVWLTETKEAAKEYGKVEKVTMNNYRIVARDGQGGVLIEKLPAPKVRAVIEKGAPLPKKLEPIRKYIEGKDVGDVPGVKRENIVSMKVFGSSVEGKAKPGDIDIFVTVKDGSMKFKKRGGLPQPIIIDKGKFSYTVMPKEAAAELLDAMLYTGRKDADRGYSGKSVDIPKSLWQGKAPEAKTVKAPETEKSAEISPVVEIKAETPTPQAEPAPGAIIKAQGAPEIASTGLKTGKFVENRKSYNPDKINAPADVDTLIKGVSEAGGEFKRQRISKTNEDIKALAQEVGVTPEDLLKTQPGSIANAETVYKSRQLVSDLAQDLRDTIRKVTTETATPSQLAEVKAKLFRLQGTMKAVAGFRTEAAHIFRQFKMEAVAGENDIMTDLVSQLKKLDGKAGDDLKAFTKGSKELLEPTITDKAWHLWYMSILSGGSTQIKNFTGNLAQMIGETAVEAVTNPKGFTNTMGGLYDGMISGWGKFKETMKAGDLSKFEERGIKPIKFTLGSEKGGPLAGVKKAGAAILNSADYVGRFMSATDSLFREGFRGFETRAAAREQALGEGLKGDALQKRINELTSTPTPEIAEQADLFAQRGTYTQKPTGVIGVLSEQMGKAARKIPGGKFVLPFTRIVANVVNNSLDWTPIGIKRALAPEGLGKTIGKMAKKAAGEEVTIESLRPRARNQELGRALLGTVAMTYFASLAADNNLSGNGPSNYNKKQQLQDTGWRPNSVKIGDKWYPYQNWGPMAIPMTLVGNYFDFVHYEKQNSDAGERAMAALLNVPNSIMDMSFLSGTADLITSVQNIGKGGEKYFTRFAASQLTSPVPNLVKQTARYFDPGVYETGTLKTYILSNLRITSGLKPKLNVFGQPIKGEALTQLQPVTITKDPTIQYLAKQELWVTVPSKATKIRPVKERQNLPKGGRPMSEDEYYNYVKYSGIEIKKRLDKRLPAIQTLKDPEKQQKLIDSIVSDVRDATKRGIEMGLIK